MKLMSIVVATCALAFAGYWFAFESDYGLADRHTETQKSIEFITVQLERKDLVNFDELEGILEYGEQFIVTSPMSGVLTDIAAEGTELQRGQLVYRLYRSVTDSEFLLAEQQKAAALSSLSQAELALERLTAGPTEAQVAAADAAVSQAEANKLRLLDGPTTAEIAAADSVILQAEANLQKLKSEPTQSEIVTADSAVMKAEGDFTDRSAKAESALYTLRKSRETYCDTAGRFYPGTQLWPPVCKDWDPEALVAMTESELQSVRENYFAYSWSLSISKDLLAASDAHTAAVAVRNSAAKAVDSAAEKRKALDVPAKSYDIEQAEAAVTSAREKRAALDIPADESEIKQAEDALDSAKKKRTDLDVPPTELEMLQAQRATVSAQASLNSADQKLNDLREGPAGAVLMYGSLPAWRDFELGMEPGKDIQQLEENLVVLGYANSATVGKDDVFDSETSKAIANMQSNLGLTTTGSLKFAEVIFMPGSSVIGNAAQFPQIGSAITDKAALVTLTPLQSVKTTIMSNGDVVEEKASLQRVSTQIDVADQNLVAIGAVVQIELPNDQIVDGQVSSVGDIAIIPTGNQGGNPYLEVVVDLVGSENLRQWTGASVTVSVTESVASNVLSAPITSLLALLGGGYALEVAENAGTRLVAVELGVYADNWVEISGAGLDENTLVVVPK